MLSRKNAAGTPPRALAGGALGSAAAPTDISVASLSTCAESSPSPLAFGRRESDVVASLSLAAQCRAWLPVGEQYRFDTPQTVTLSHSEQTTSGGAHDMSSFLSQSTICSDLPGEIATSSSNHHPSLPPRPRQRPRHGNTDVPPSGLLDDSPGLHRGMVAQRIVVFSGQGDGTPKFPRGPGPGHSCESPASRGSVARRPSATQKSPPRRPTAEDFRQTSGSSMSRRASTGSLPTLGMMASPNQGSRDENAEEIIQVFLEAHPLFRGEIWRISSDQYVIRGRVVTEATGWREAVLIDGWHRPLGEALEDFWSEYLFERRAKSGDACRQMVDDLLEDRGCQSASQIVRRSFDVWRDIWTRRQVAVNAVLRRQVVRQLAQCWAAWVTSIFLEMRRQQYRQKCLHGVGALLQRHLEVSHILILVVWAAWCCMLGENHSLKYVKLTGSIDSLHHTLQRCVAAANRQLTLVGDEAFSLICFLRWHLEVEGRRRHSADSFLLGAADSTRRDMDALGKQLIAKDLQLSEWTHPEVELTRLAGVVDDLLRSLDVKGRAPRLLPAAQRVIVRGCRQKGGNESWQQALDGFAALAQAKSTVQKLQVDIDHVLLLRCFSSWAHGIGFERVARGHASLDKRQQVLDDNCMLLAHRHLFLARRCQARTVFDAWAVVTSVSRMLRRSEEMFSAARKEELDHLERQRHIVHAAKAVVYRRISTVSEDELRVVFQHWRTLSATSRMVSLADTGLRQADARLSHASHVRGRLMDKAVSTCQRMLAEMERGVVFRGWASIMQRSRPRKARQDMCKSHWEVETRGLVSRAFAAFVAWKSLGLARRLVDRAACRAARSALSANVPACFFAWAADSQWSRSLKKHSLAKERTLGLRRQVSDHAGLVFERLAHARSEALLTTFLGLWRTSALQNQHDEFVSDRQVLNLQVDSRIKVSAVAARKWAMRLLGRRTEAFLQVTQLAVVLEWSQLSRAASFERKVAGEWTRSVHRQETEGFLVAHQVTCKLRLRSLVQNVIVAHSSCALLNVVHDWRQHSRSLSMARKVAEAQAELSMGRRSMKHTTTFWMWREHTVRKRLRHAGLQMGLAITDWGDLCIVNRIFFVWRQEVASALAQRAVEIQAQRPPILVESFDGAHEENLLRARSRAIAAQEACQCHRIITVWRAWSRHKAWTRTRDVHFAIVALQAWKLCWRSSRLEQKLEVTQRMQRSGHPTTFMHRLSSESETCARATRRFARWYQIRDEKVAALPRCFSAWVLAISQRASDEQFEWLSQRVAHLKAHYRESAMALLGHNLSWRCLRTLVLECLIRWCDHVCDCGWQRMRQHLRAHHTESHSRLYDKQVQMSTLKLMVCTLIEWRLHVVKLQRGEIEEFRSQADGVALRLQRLNARTFGFLTTTGAFSAWRSASRRRGRSQLHVLARKQVDDFESIRRFRMAWECFLRWSRALDWQGFMVPVDGFDLWGPDSACKACVRSRE
mmetsp:Transcript_4657/g.17521  ORF Transcript_4657/g.17521 Transcript_4657/m.17521 type:complete len:1471 (-) Transcript_4657:209-4621(-)